MSREGEGLEISFCHICIIPSQDTRPHCHLPSQTLLTIMGPGHRHLSSCAICPLTALELSN